LITILISFNKTHDCYTLFQDKTVHFAKAF